jgi:hypothetical protein
MEIWFVPNYFYLNLPYYEQIAREVQDDSIHFALLSLPGHTGHQEEALYGSSYFKARGFTLLQHPLVLVPNYRSGLLPKLKLLAATMRNFFTLRKVIRNGAPDLVIVGSDTGPLNVRLFLGWCTYFRIPVSIVYATDFTLAGGRSRNSPLYRKIAHYCSRALPLVFLRALIFSGEVPGSYALNSKVFVMSESVRRKLISQGISPERLYITGLPAEVVPGDDQGRLAARESLLEELNIDKHSRLVILFTECIQYVYGEEYALSFYTKICQVFNELPDDIIVLIKLHPRESREVGQAIEGTFSASRFKVLRDVDAGNLFAIADLCLAHFSRVLIEAAVRKIRFLSINWVNDRKHTFLLPEDSEALEILAPEKTGQKITMALEDKAFIEEMDRQIERLYQRLQADTSIGRIISI